MGEGTLHKDFLTGKASWSILMLLGACAEGTMEGESLVDGYVSGLGFFFCEGQVDGIHACSSHTLCFPVSLSIACKYPYWSGLRTLHTPLLRTCVIFVLARVLCPPFPPGTICFR